MSCCSSGKYVYLLYMYSILGRGSFCFNYCLNSAWHGGDQFVALLRWYGSPGFFDSGLQLICIFWSRFSFSSWQYPIDFLASVHSLWSSPKFLKRFCLTILIRLRFFQLFVQFFLPHFFPSTQLSVNMLGYSTLWTASFFGSECLWLILLVKGVNDCLLDNCQISSLAHDCVV